MTAVRLVWRTDVHLSDTPPASRKDDWATTVFGKLRQVSLLAGKIKAAAILDGGDFFHVKSPGRNTHDLVRRVADLHRECPCPVYANIGNHDCVYGDYGYIDQQPLGVLFSTGVFRRCYDEYEVFFGPDRADPNTVRSYPFHRSSGWVDGCPFDVSGSEIPIVRVVGVPYHGTQYDMGRFSSIRKGPEDFLVCMAHVLASERGGSMFEGEDIVKYADLVGFDPQVLCFGHWHKDQGVVQLGEKVIVNVGSLTRGALSQDELTRKPACVILTFNRNRPVETQVVRLRVGLPEAVFDIDGRIRAESRTSTIDAFVESVKAKLIAEQGRDIVDIVREMPDIPNTVRERVLLYLEKTSVD